MNKKNIADLVKVGVVAVAIIGTAGVVGYSRFATDTVVTTINDTQTKRYHKSDKYLVFTDAGVFENTDAWYRGKFRSSDLQGELMKQKGKRVELQKYGWRFGPFSWYENLVGVKPVQ